MQKAETFTTSRPSHTTGNSVLSGAGRASAFAPKSGVLGKRDMSRVGHAYRVFGGHLFLFR